MVEGADNTEAGNNTGVGDVCEASNLEHDVETPFLATSPRPHRQRVLKLLPLIALIFYEVSGGPFGIEVGASPPYLPHEE